MDNSNENGSSFWRNNKTAVPGRPKDFKYSRTVASGGSSSTSFQDFQESVSDAWDTGDDEFCIISALNGM